MIVDEQEYRVAKEQVKRFAQAIAALKRQDGAVDPRLVEMLLPRVEHAELRS